MTVKFFQYNHPEDYWRVDEFLIAHYQPGNADGNWLEPTWEYMHGHPLLDSSSLDKIGIWEDGGEIVGVVHYESRLGEAFLQFHPAYRHLLQEMLDYAEQNLVGTSSRDARKYLAVYVNDNNEAFRSFVHARGFKLNSQGTRPLYQFTIPAPFPPVTVPVGFQVKSLADDPDWSRVNRVLHRGFNHVGEPPDSQDELDSRRRMFDTPKAQRNLKIVVQAPNGEFVALCGMFFEPTHGYAYVEPVATDPNYRRLGLGKAAVLEGIRRCGVLGASVAYVGSDQEFYQVIGFKKVYNSESWEKYYDTD